MDERKRGHVGFAAMALAALLGVAADGENVPPDLTQNHMVDRKLTHNLGATGLRGWNHTKAAKAIEAGTAHPELRSTSPTRPPGGSGK